MDRGLAWGFVALTLAYGLRFLTIQMRLFKRQYTGFARLNGLSLLLQVVAWSAFLVMDSSITATLAVATLAAAEGLDMPGCICEAGTQQAIACGPSDPPRGWGFAAAIQGIHPCHSRKQQGGF